MSEQYPEHTHQDPAEPNEVNTEVETNEQPDQEEVSPWDPEPAADKGSSGKTDNILGNDYTVDPDQGYRRS